MILIAENQKLQMREVLSHPLEPLPWALSTADGSLRKTNKAALAKELQKSVSFEDVIPQPPACMIDAMAFVQRLKTFAEVAEYLLCFVLQEGSNSKRMDVLFDVYKENSMKNAEREKRGAESGNEFRNIQSAHKVQHWIKFLLNSKNKKVFTEFMVKEWRRDKYRTKLTGEALFVTCESDCACYDITSQTDNIVEELNSTQEEADTRLILHAAHAARSGCKAMVVASEDTDIFLLCLAFKYFIPASMYVKCGTQTRTRYVSISGVLPAVGRTFQILIGMHAFTGCDQLRIQTLN